MEVEGGRGMGNPRRSSRATNFGVPPLFDFEEIWSKGVVGSKLEGARQRPLSMSGLLVGCVALTWILRTAALPDHAIPIDRIAHQVGFKNRHHFSRVFREITGTTPGQYRLTHRRNDPSSEKGLAKKAHVRPEGLPAVDGVCRSEWGEVSGCNPIVAQFKATSGPGPLERELAAKGSGRAQASS